MLHLMNLATAPAQRPRWRVLLVLLLGAISWLALVPNPPQQLSTGWDKSNHLLAFGALAFTAVWALWPEPRQWGRLVAAGLAYGAAIELLQGLLPPRSCDWRDLIADGVGLALGLAVAAGVRALARHGGPR